LRVSGDVTVEYRNKKTERPIPDTLGAT